jgi:hypothetical protein
MQVKSKAKSMLINFSDCKATAHKIFVLAGQTVSSAYYCDVLRRLRENVQRLGRPELRRQKNWLLHNSSFFTREFLTKKTT